MATCIFLSLNRSEHLIEPSLGFGIRFWNSASCFAPFPGPIPLTLGGLKALECLWLTNNQLSGEFIKRRVIAVRGPTVVQAADPFRAPPRHDIAQFLSWIWRTPALRPFGLDALPFCAVVV